MAGFEGSEMSWSFFIGKIYQNVLDWDIFKLQIINGRKHALLERSEFFSVWY